MSFAGHRARLAALTRDLSNRWHDTRLSWRDARAEEFEKTYMRDLLAHMDRTVATLEELEALLGKTRKDCE